MSTTPSTRETSTSTAAWIGPLYAAQRKAIQALVAAVQHECDECDSNCVRMLRCMADDTSAFLWQLERWDRDALSRDAPHHDESSMDDADTAASACHIAAVKASSEALLRAYEQAIRDTVGGERNRAVCHQFQRVRENLSALHAICP